MNDNGHPTSNGTTLTVDPTGIPFELLERRQWVAWRTETPRGRKPTKIPYNPKSQAKAQSNNPPTWGSFGEALSMHHRGYDGVGYVFSPDDEFFGIDLDACRNPETGELTPWAKEIVDTFATYTEVSPSGYGVKLTAKGRLPLTTADKTGKAKKLKDVPTFGAKEPEIALFDRGRFWTYTGRRHPNTPETVEQRQAEVDALWVKLWPPRVKAIKHESKSTAKGNVEQFTDRCADALQVMLRIDRQDGNDGSLRLLMACCRAVEYGLNDEESIRTIRAYEHVKPFPVPWSDADILKRLADARQKATPQDDEFNLTDLGNAKRLVQQHGYDLLYCHPWLKWFWWDGKRFAEDQTGEVERRAKAITRSLWHEAAEHPDEAQRSRLAKWATQSEKAERIAAMLKLARSESGIPVLPSMFDADPWLLNVLDGVIELKTGRLLAHERSYHCTKLCPTEYGNELGIECPLWEEFLERIFDDNRALIEFMQRILGYSLVGAVFEHILPVFHGNGANGKSVLIETVLGVLGSDYASKGVSDLLLAKRNETHPTERADLFGKRFVACVETEDGRRLAENTVKELSGGDTIKARRMREDFWQFKPSHLAVLVTNHRPIVKDTGNSIWRRLKLVPFAVTIPLAEQDKHLVEKLLAERTGILRWLVAGCLAWQRDGLAEPPEVQAATTEYKNEMDVLKTFIDERCIEGPINEEEPSKSICRVKASELYAAYGDWSKRAGEYTLSQRRFGLAINEREYKRYTNNGVWYAGISLRMEGEF